MSPDLHGRDQFERAYAELLKRMNRHAYRPGERISITTVALELGLSQTPIREALSRLVGQNLLIDRRGEGYYVPRADARIVGSLYRLYCMLLETALRTVDWTATRPPRALPQDDDDEAPEAHRRVHAAFRWLVRLARDPPLGDAAGLVDLRLRPLRRCEPQILTDARSEAEGMLDLLANADRPTIRRAIREYHLRRQRVAQAIAAKLGDTDHQIYEL